MMTPLELEKLDELNHQLNRIATVLEQLADAAIRYDARKPDEIGHIVIHTRSSSAS